ncbi:hypothetical protein AAG570_006981 [Ranatra chinensis]|uniref:Secreted protein n=1 Tax=Ranatra chinensis TaxID=642074 RepID=A0ABD0YVM4_9HEMI
MKCDGWAVVAVVAVVGALCECHDGEGGRFANLDRLLDRLGGTTTEQPAPQPGAAEGTTAAPEHHRRHWASWLRKNDKLDTEDEDDDDEEDYDEEEQQDVGNRKSYTVCRTYQSQKVTELRIPISVVVPHSHSTLRMASKCRDMFEKNSKQETTEIGRDHNIVIDHHWNFLGTAGGSVSNRTSLLLSKPHRNVQVRASTEFFLIA